MTTRIKCDTCPRCKDVYPGKVDEEGYHFYICGMGGNKVYKEPRKVKRIYGDGYLRYPVSGCGMYASIDEALAHMTPAEIKRWEEQNNGEQKEGL